MRTYRKKDDLDEAEVIIGTLFDYVPEVRDYLTYQNPELMGRLLQWQDRMREKRDD